MTAARTETYNAVIEAGAADAALILVCEHASHVIPSGWAGLGLDPAAARAHIAWDPGALDLARGLARALGAWLVHAPVSRLVYDLNRSPDHPGAMPARSEIFDIPGNMGLTGAQRAIRTAAIYAPFHADLSALIAQRLALGIIPVLVTIHSFTPIWHGTQRKVEFGVIHDADPSLGLRIVEQAQGADLQTALNQPYSADDGVTHMLRLHATPYGLQNAMLEVRNDLIATPGAAQAMALRLAPMLSRAMAARTVEVA